MSSLSRSNNVKRPFSEIRLRKLEKAGSMETFRVIVGGSPPSNSHLFKEWKALKEFLLLEFTVYFMCLLSVI